LSERLWGVAALDDRRARSERVLDDTASRRQGWIDGNRYFYKQVIRLLKFVIPEGQRVLMFRSDTGDLLASLAPSRGVGIEISANVVELARKRHPNLEFRRAFPDEPSAVDLAGAAFDTVVMANINDTVDVLQCLANARLCCEERGRLVIYTINGLWAPIVQLAERLGLKVSAIEPNWLSEDDLKNLLVLARFEWLKTYRAVLAPINVPGISWLLNRVIAKVPLLDRLCFVEVLVARPIPAPIDPSTVGVSVIVPCRNERGNIADAVRRIPEMGAGTEIIFCDDKSDDGTAEEVERMIREHPERDIKLVAGPGICKAENVWTGFRAARRDVLMILDADLTTIPEELPSFLTAITSGVGDFINGSRLVYPMPSEAMKASNILGNKAFSIVFIYVLDQRVKDTLCGTKVLWRKDWPRHEALLGSWGISDRWGDYELLFGAAKLNQKIIDLPVHYQERIYGLTKMTRVFYNGLRMLRMCFHGFIGLKLKY
jgi:hypothetical protein